MDDAYVQRGKRFSARNGMPQKPYAGKAPEQNVCQCTPTSLVGFHQRDRHPAPLAPGLHKRRADAAIICGAQHKAKGKDMGNHPVRYKCVKVRARLRADPRPEGRPLFRALQNPTTRDAHKNLFIGLMAGAAKAFD